jgi:uncharacterized protein YndB with AHSA1/START domain
VSAAGGPTAARAAARAEIVVDAAPEQAFRLFTEEIGFWWRRDTPYWNDRERGLFVRLEPGVGGRLVEVHDADTGAGFEAGRVTAWEPGARLALTWTQVGWPEDAFTDIEVTFEPAGDGTLVRLRQTGFERVGAGAAGFRAGYESGWREVLGWFAGHVSSPGADHENDEPRPGVQP